MNKYQQEAKTDAQKWYWGLQMTKRKAIQSKYNGTYFMGYQDDEFIQSAYDAEHQTPDSKEGLHTQGEWEVKLWSDGSIDIISPINEKRFNHICQVTGSDKYGETQANAELIVKAVNERKALPDLLKKIYHEIDIECISETENVSMTTIRAILVKHGANEPDLW